MIDESGAHIIDRPRCTACEKCADSCFAKALTLVGVDNKLILENLKRLSDS